MKEAIFLFDRTSPPTVLWYYLSLEFIQCSERDGLEEFFNLCFDFSWKEFSRDLWNYLEESTSSIVVS